MERYLAVVRQAPVRRLVTRLRCAVLRLRVEEGRYEERRAEQQGRQLTEAEKQQLRHCPICPGCVEDEVHFVMACGAYQQHREQLWQTLHGHFGDKWTSVGAAAAGGAGGGGVGTGVEERYGVLMACENPKVIGAVARFVAAAWRVRSQLVGG